MKNTMKKALALTLVLSLSLSSSAFGGWFGKSTSLTKTASFLKSTQNIIKMVTAGIVGLAGITGLGLYLNNKNKKTKAPTTKTQAPMTEEQKLKAKQNQATQNLLDNDIEAQEQILNFYAQNKKTAKPAIQKTTKSKNFFSVMYNKAKNWFVKKDKENTSKDAEIAKQLQKQENQKQADYNFAQNLQQEQNPAPAPKKDVSGSRRIKTSSKKGSSRYNPPTNAYRRCNNRRCVTK